MNFTMDYTASTITWDSFTEITYTENKTDYFKTTSDANATQYDEPTGPVREYIEYVGNVLAAGLWTYVSPMIVISGCIGNGLSFLVMSQKRLQATLTSFLLRYLAIVDSVVLLTGLLRQWLRWVANVDVRSLTSSGCKIHIFTTYWSRQYSAWILAGITCERLISVVFPHSGKRYLTKRNVTVCLVVIGLCLFLLCSHWFVNAELMNFGSTDRPYWYCYIPKNQHFVFYIWPYIDYVFFFVIPFVTIAGGNAAIIRRLYRSKFSAQGSDERQVKMTSMTFILILVAVYFMISTTPGGIYLVIQTIWSDWTDDHAWSLLNLYWAIANILQYSNNAINFFLYCLSGPRFRRELLALFCKNRVHPGDSTVSATLEMQSMHTKVVSVAQHPEAQD